jgi:hypothetical protein
MLRDRSRDCLKKNLRRYRLGQEILRTCFDGSYHGLYIGMAREEYDRQCCAEFSQALLNCRAA